MVQFRSAILTIWILCCITISAAQDSPFSIFPFGSYTTSSKLFHHSSDPDPTLRNTFIPVDNIFSGGIEVIKSFPAIQFHLGLSAEYISRLTTTTELNNQSIPVSIRNGYYAIPIELTGYFFLPLDLDRVRIFIGGGGGIYFGGRVYSYNGISSIIVQQRPGAGVHVVSGVDVALRHGIVFRSSVKFRDINFQSVNRWAENLATNVLHSRVNIDGMVVTLGLLFQL